MEALRELEDNLSLLIQRCQAQQQQIDELCATNQRQYDEIMQAHAQIVQLKKEYDHLCVAHALLTNDPEKATQREKTKQQLTNIIARIDRAIEILKQ